MATKLTKPISRELTTQYKNRAVLLTMRPADPATAVAESVELRLKGTQHKATLTTAELVDIVRRFTSHGGEL